MERANLRRAKLSEKIILKMNPKVKQLTGYKWNIIFFLSSEEKIIKIGCEVHYLEEWKSFTDEQIEKMDPGGLKDWKKYRHIILAIANDN